MGVHTRTLAESLDGADLVFVYRPDGMSDDFDDSLAVLGQRLTLTPNYDDLVSAMTDRLLTGDQVVFMSNGGFGATRQKLTMELQKRAVSPA
jgi:UDP-N-acetylmuramate: L-alanyl-gamma-D-glutamyl-meso-diaminopimelate ligase